MAVLLGKAMLFQVYENSIEDVSRGLNRMAYPKMSFFGLDRYPITGSRNSLVEVFILEKSDLIFSSIGYGLNRDVFQLSRS